MNGQILEAIDRLNSVFYELANQKLDSLAPKEKQFLINMLDELTIIVDYSFEDFEREMATVRLGHYLGARQKELKQRSASPTTTATEQQ